MVNVSKCLKTSLSKTLTRFYPFAGRIDGNDASIECNDEGAIFVEARVHGAIALVIHESDYGIRKKFGLSGPDGPMETDHLLKVQANFFECGGLVIGLSVSHKVADVSTVVVFIKAWSAATLNPNDDVVGFADFYMASILPTVQLDSLLRAPQIKRYGIYNFTMKRYVFDKSKIMLLKEKASTEGVTNPTRVECMSSILWKCLMAASRSRFGVERPSIFF
ncbi:hypothetical protein ACFE04_031079 [Oxalis oulophora]